MEDEIKRWTASVRAGLVLDIIQGKTTVAEASRAYDLSPSEVEQWVNDAKRGKENALRASPLDIKEQYEHQLKETCKRPMAKRCWSCVLEKSSKACWTRKGSDSFVFGRA